MSLLALPVELREKIVFSLTSRAAINAVSQASRELYHIANPYLYRYDGRHCGSYALEWAVRRGRESIAELALAFGADITIWVKEGSLVAVAASRGYASIVQLLLHHAVEPVTIRELEKETPISQLRSWPPHKQAGRDEVKVKAIVEAAVRGGHTSAVAPAALRNHIDIVRLFLDAGIDANLTDEFGASALESATYGGHLAVAELLIKHGADINKPNLRASSPVRQAARGGHEAMVRFVLSHGGDRQALLDGLVFGLRYRLVALVLETDIFAHGADFNETSRNVCITAAQTGDCEVMDLLLQYGLNPCLTDMYDRTPLDWAAENGALDIIRCLLKRGVSVNDGTMRNALHNTASGSIGHLDSRVVSEALPATSQATAAVGTIRKPPISHAAARGNLKAVQLLLEFGADLERRDATGRTPFSWAATSANRELVRELYNIGADVDAPDINGTTPQQWAGTLGYEGLVLVTIGRL